MRAGTSGQMYQGTGAANYVADKAFRVTTDNANTSGDVNMTFYFTEAEIAGWEAASGRDRSDLLIIREVGGNVEESIAATVGAFNSDVTLSASFSGADGDFYFGPMGALSVASNQLEVFGLYPNPSNGEVTVKLNANSDVNVTLYDIRGRKVFNNNYTNNNSVFNKTINFNTVSSGLYLIEFVSGNKKTVKKLLIK